jgi:hypothetical protein
MTTSYSPLIVTDGLVMYLDAANSKSYPGAGINWTDISRNNNNGILTNGPTFSSANLGSIVFDGVDDYVSTSINTSTLNLTTSNGATIMCWLNITLLSRWTGIINFTSNIGNDADFGWDLDPSNIVRVWKNGSALSVVDLSPYNNKWALYTLTSTTSNLNFYINNNTPTSAALSGNINTTAGRNLVIMDHWDNPVSGRLSSVVIYNRALTASEILQNYNATKTRYGL